MPRSYKERLEAFYAKYDPAKVSSVDQMLEKYVGKEERFIEAMVKKYGPEPEAPTAAAPADAKKSSSQPRTPQKSSVPGGTTPSRTPATTSPARDRSPTTTTADKPATGQRSYKERLEAFYAKYDPAKVSSVDQMLGKYVGKEERFIEAMVKKYGPEPEAPSKPKSAPAKPHETPAASHQRSYKERLEAFYAKYDPAKVSSVDQMLEKYVGKEERFIEAMVKKYGPEPAPSAATATPEPRKTSPQPRAAHKSSAPGGTTPSRTPATTSPARDRSPTTTTADKPTTGQRSYKERLEAFYAKYDPAKVSSVDQMLEKYVGKEERFIEAMVKKYGPEPAPTAATATPEPRKTSPQPRAAQKSNAPSATPTTTPSRTPATTSPARDRSPTTTTADKPATGQRSYKERLEAFYAKYDPAKVSSVDQMLEKYVGKEERFIEAMVKKYGPEPEAPPKPKSAPAKPHETPAASHQRSYKERLEAFYAKYDPAKVSSVDQMLEKYVGKEERFIEAMVKKYGPEPEASPAQSQHTSPARQTTLSYKERLEAFYAKYDPVKVSSVDQMLEKYAGKEERFIEAMVKKYGPEPEAPAAENLSMLSGSGSPDYINIESPEDFEAFKQRLVRFYTHYSPDKVEAIDEILQQFVGKEGVLIRSLVKKYGPEPPEDEQEEHASKVSTKEGSDAKSASSAKTSAASSARVSPAARTEKSPAHSSRASSAQSRRISPARSSPSRGASVSHRSGSEKSDAGSNAAVPKSPQHSRTASADSHESYNDDIEPIEDFIVFCDTEWDLPTHVTAEYNERLRLYGSTAVPNDIRPEEIHQLSVRSNAVSDVDSFLDGYYDIVGNDMRQADRGNAGLVESPFRAPLNPTRNSSVMMNAQLPGPLAVRSPGEKERSILSARNGEVDPVNLTPSDLALWKKMHRIPTR